MAGFKFIPGRPPGPPKKDYRTIQFKQIVCALPPAPETADVDVQVGGMDDHFMWLNDTYGDCVVADWLANLLRHEKFEQGIQITATDDDAKKEYFGQTGGADSGLVMLDYLNHLRKDGILVQGKTYKIHAFAEIQPKDHEDIRNGVNLFRGVYFGMQVPQSMEDQFNAGEMFTYVPGSPILGGHAVYCPAYLKYGVVDSVNIVGPVVRTWAKRVQATWEWWDNLVDEVYITIDEVDSWLNNPNSPLDVGALEALLAEITNSPPPPPIPPVPPAPPKPSGCFLIRWLRKIF
jgi:hypothetical protein